MSVRAPDSSYSQPLWFYDWFPALTCWGRGDTSKKTPFWCKNSIVSKLNISELGSASGNMGCCREREPHRPKRRWCSHSPWSLVSPEHSAEQSNALSSVLIQTRSCWSRAVGWQLCIPTHSPNTHVCVEELCEPHGVRGCVGSVLYAHTRVQP